MNKVDFTQGLLFAVSAFAAIDRGARYAMFAATPVVGAALLPGVIASIGLVATSALSLGAAYLAEKQFIRHETAVSATLIFSVISVAITVVALAALGATPAIWATLLVLSTLFAAGNVACAVLRKNNAIEARNAFHAVTRDYLEGL